MNNPPNVSASSVNISRNIDISAYNMDCFQVVVTHLLVWLRISRCIDAIDTCTRTKRNSEIVETIFEKGEIMQSGTEYHICAGGRRRQTTIVVPLCCHWCQSEPPRPLRQTRMIRFEACTAEDVRCKPRDSRPASLCFDLVRNALTKRSNTVSPPRDTGNM